MSEIISRGREAASVVRISSHEAIFYIWTRPQAKERARIVFRNGKAHGFTPTKTRNYESTVRLYAMDAIRGVRPKFLGNVCIDLNFCFARPKHSKLLYPRQDLDNLVKSVLDGLNGIAFKDDSQVIRLTASKDFSADNWEYTRVGIQQIKES